MKRIFAYLRIELKKGIRVIPFFIQSFLVTTVVLGLALALICHFMLQSQTFVKMNIGVVVPDQETNTRMAMKLVSAMDSVDSICKFSYPDEETAREELADGKLAAVILLTEDFYNDVNDGVNTPVDILLAPDSPFDEAVFTELVRAGVSMLQTAQAAVYAVDEASGEYRLSMSKSDMEYELSYLYLSYAFARNSTFAEQEETPLGAVSLGEFYIVCGAVVLSLVFGFCFLSLYRSESRDFMRCLRRIGVNAPLQSVMRIFVMALDLWLVLTGCYVAFNIVYAKMIGSVAMIFPRQIAGFFFYALALAAFFHFVFALLGDSENGGLIYLLTAVFLIICAGGLFPMAAFPGWMQKLSGVLPLAWWQKYLTGLLWTKVEIKTVLVLIFGSIFFGGAGAFVLYEKTKR